MTNTWQASVGKQATFVHSSGASVGPCVVSAAAAGNLCFAFDDGHMRIKKDGNVDFRGGKPLPVPPSARARTHTHTHKCALRVLCAPCLVVLRGPETRR